MTKAIFLVPILVLIVSAPTAVFAKHHGSMSSSSSASQSCDNSQGTCGNTPSQTDYQRGLDEGTLQAQSAIPSCGSNSACYSDFSPSDCQDSAGNNAQDPVAYCQGFIKGYYDTAGLPSLDVSGR